MNNFTKILKDLRLEKNLTIGELADKIGYSKTVVYYWETGKRSPNTNALKVLSKFFGVSIDYLLGIEDDLGVKEYAPADAAPGATERAMGDEAELLRAFRKLSPFARSAVMVQVKALAEDQEELPAK